MRVAVREVLRQEGVGLLNGGLTELNSSSTAYSSGIACVVLR